MKEDYGFSLIKAEILKQKKLISKVKDEPRKM